MFFEKKLKNSGKKKDFTIGDPSKLLRKSTELLVKS